MRRFFLLMVANILRYRRGDMRTFVVCVLISSFFWLAQKFNREYETKLKVPFRLETNLSFASSGNIPEFVTALVKSSGWMLFIHNLSFFFSPLVVAVADPMADNQKTDLKAEIFNSLNERLFEVNLKEIEMPDFDFSYTATASKDVFLKMDLTAVEVAQGCKMVSTSLRPESFVVNGNKDELKKIPDTLLIPIEAKMLESTFTKQFNIEDLNTRKEQKSFTVFARIEVECGN